MRQNRDEYSCFEKKAAETQKHQASVPESHGILDAQQAYRLKRCDLLRNDQFTPLGPSFLESVAPVLFAPVFPDPDCVRKRVLSRGDWMRMEPHTGGFPSHGRRWCQDVTSSLGARSPIHSLDAHRPREAAGKSPWKHNRLPSTHHHITFSCSFNFFLILLTPHTGS